MDAETSEEPLQAQASSSEDLQLRKDSLEAEVQISHNELQKQKIARELLEEQLKTLDCQLLDSTAEKEEIQSLLKDLAAQTSACAKAQEQVQKALKDMEELAAANGAAKVDEGMESSTQVQDMPNLVELQQSNDAVKALLKTFCDRLHRQRVEREKLEAKLRSEECQFSDPTKQDELKTLQRDFALCSAANLKAEAAIQAVLNDLEALKASRDLEVAMASFMGDAKAAVAAEEAPKDATATNCLAPRSAGDSEAAAAMVEVPRHVAAAYRYDLKKPHALAQFLQDADIRLIRAKYLNDLARSKRPLPRRQEAESESFVFDGMAKSALVSHAEVQNWAAGAQTATICSVSHAWETREHPDPCRYQLQLVADRAAWYEAAFETEVWIFYDFTSLFQYERLFSKEENSFRAAMKNMHIMYAHECTMTFIIEHLTPTEIWESTMKNEQELIPVWDDKLRSIKSKPLSCLIKNRTEYIKRGWCIGEISWSSLRTHNSQSQRIDWLGSDQVEPGQGQGLTGKVPLTPEKFKERMTSAEFTHRDEDLPIVVELQKKIFDEKVAVCEHLVLKGLPEQEISALAGALPLYRSLKTLKLDTFLCSEEAAEAFGKALATSQIVSLELLNPRPGSGALMGKAVVDALRTNKSLTDIKAEDFDPTAQKALVKALRKNRSIKERLPFDAPVRFKVVAERLEKNAIVTSITVDPADDLIDDQRAKVVAQLLKSGSPVKSVDLGNTCVSDVGAQVLAEALHCNQTLEVLCLHEDQITDVGTKALAGALEVNKTLRSLMLAEFWEVLKTVEEMKRSRGDDFRFISTKDEKEAEKCGGSIFEAARDGHVRAVRHLLRAEPGSLQQTDILGDTALHEAARCGKAEVVELLIAANAPLDVKNDRNGWTPLHFAASRGQPEVVQLLLKAKAPVDAQTNDGATPLHYAARDGHTEVVQLLLEAKAQVDAQDDDGRTPLHWAAAKGHVEVVKLLVEVASLAVQNREGNTPLHQAAAQGETAVVELLIAAKAPVDVQKHKGNTPLHDAAERGRAEVVELLLAANAPVDVKNENGTTPLHHAARDGHTETVQLLLEAKAQVDAQDDDGDTPLHEAAIHGKAEVVELLVAANAPLDVKNEKGATPLHIAAVNGHPEVVQLLLEAKAPVDAQLNGGWTPLLLAAAYGHVEVVKLLVEVASLAVQGEDGDTPLHKAASNGRAEVVELLLAANAPVDVKNEKGRTALHLAAVDGQVDMVKHLLKAKAGVDVQTQNSNTPLHLAAREGATEVVELLIAANAPVDVKNKDGHTPLDEARQKEEAGTIRLLEAAQAVAPRPDD